jgi:hypothetical protein
VAIPAQNVLAKLHLLNKPKIGPNLEKKLGRLSADQALSEFGSYLKWLALRHLRRHYSDKYLVDGCFGTQPLKNSLGVVSDGEIVAAHSVVDVATAAIAE